MSDPEIVDDFYGVYLLYNINPKFKGRTYIGYTRDPLRRITQHNRGTWAGGAHRTNNKGPWKMVLVIHGFPNNISALRFEWAWQNPTKTIRLQHLDLKKLPRKETEVQFKIRVLSEILRVGPWYRLPLTIQWLEQDFYEEFPPERKPPNHITTSFGAVKSRNLKGSQVLSTVPEVCQICSRYIYDYKILKCVNEKCNLVAHLSCLAETMLSPGEYVPIEGSCPVCNINLKWGVLIRKMSRRNYVESTELELSDEEKSQDKVFVDNNSWFLDCND